MNFTPPPLKYTSYIGYSLSHFPRILANRLAKLTEVLMMINAGFTVAVDFENDSAQ